jgi:threonine synthase
MYDLGLIDRLPRIVCAQAQRANPLYLSYLNGFKEFHPVKAQKTLASAIQIGNPVSINKAIKTLKTFDGIVEQASEEELSNAVALVDRTGTFNCPHTGVAIAVLLKLHGRKTFKAKDRVVIISTAHGLKFIEFKIGYHEKRLEGIASKYANTPVELPPNLREVKKEIFKNIGQNN